LVQESAFTLAATTGNVSPEMGTTAKKTGMSVRSLGEVREKTCLGRQSPETGHNG
jgi:hypothetical protein